MWNRFKTMLLNNLISIRFAIIIIVFSGIAILSFIVDEKFALIFSALVIYVFAVYMIVLVWTFMIKVNLKYEMFKQESEYKIEIERWKNIFKENEELILVPLKEKNKQINSKSYPIRYGAYFEDGKIIVYKISSKYEFYIVGEYNMTYESYCEFKENYKVLN